MREIVLDTETTGLDPLRGDRLVEIGCIEIYNRMPTGQTFHRYINPQRAAGDSQRLVRHQLHQRRTRPHQAAADLARSPGRYIVIGSPQASGRVEPAGRSLLAL